MKERGEVLWTSKASVNLKSDEDMAFVERKKVQESEESPELPW